MNVGFTERLARASARSPWRVVGIWVGALVLAIVTIALLLPSALTSEQEVTNEPESIQAEQLIEERFPRTSYIDEIVVVRSSTDRFGSAAFAAKVQEVRAAVRATGAVRSIADPLTLATADELVSPDRDAVAMPVVMGSDPEEGIEKVVAAVEAAGGGGYETGITGTFTTDRDFLQLSQDDLREGELFFGAPAALIVLLLVFGAVVAGLMPLLLAIAAIIVALALTALLGQAFELSFFVVNMITGMGLALGIDYSLFIVSRYREERRHGTDQNEAIAAAGATASRAVLFSGIAFALALLGMVLVPDSILRSLGTGAILVAVVAVVAALTLLPALLSLLGDRVDALRLPYVGTTAGAEGRFWSRIVGSVMRRPIASLVASVGVLLALAAPILDLTTGFAGISTIPERFPSRQGFDLYTQEFGGGSTDPAIVVVDGNTRTEAVQQGIRRLQARLQSDEVFGSSTVQEAPGRDAAIVSAPVRGDPSSRAAVNAIERLREQYVPQSFDGTGARALVTGETAEQVDYFALVDRWLPIVFAFVLGLSFVLLTIAFRSLVVAVKAIVLNLLSVGAAYGLLVLVFQKGVGNEIFGFEQVETVEAWVPLFLFSVLFGLSMDYHVFLLSRIRERFILRGDNDEAVRHGVASTARLITGAALIIIAVFSGFARGDLVMFQQMGFGVAVSLLIDATLIRSVLVPAAMKLLGQWNWYLPSWLDWLPHLQVEPARR